MRLERMCEASGVSTFTFNYRKVFIVVALHSLQGDFHAVNVSQV